METTAGVAWSAIEEKPAAGAPPGAMAAGAEPSWAKPSRVHPLPDARRTPPMNATATAVPQRTRDDMGGMKVKGKEESGTMGLAPSLHLKHRRRRSVRIEHSVPRGCGRVGSRCPPALMPGR